MRTPLKLFMYGYWGWGNATDKMVESFAAAEKARGYKPPLFVDVRIHRDVRADGFHGDHFERVAGAGNYVWMPTLGNLAVRKDLKEVLGDRIVICHPDDAVKLLELAYSASKRKQRVIFFCSCPGPDGCHRFEVAKLLKKAARNANRRIEVVEWPGETPEKQSIEVEVTNKSMPTAANPNLFLRRVRPFPLGKYASLPVGSLVKVTINGETREFAVNPARYSRPKRSWYLETLRDDGYVGVAPTKAAVAKYRKAYQYDPI